MGLTERETKKYTDFSEEQIESYLDEFKDLIRKDRFSISLNSNRQENIEFMEDYNINTERAKEILLCLEVLDFCYAADNKNPKFAHEKLYIFCREFELDNRGTLERLDIYVKSNLTKTRKGDNILFVVSFHKRNNPIEYCFK
ncbi:hypothetical protein U0355_04775 [Salimicrobium sp. PL1-032A]|uniref:hypothetical protein n=1 Tax=Salimicrobium sp. PL1-032A TaxID=3095364 RepID=UPI0032618946